MTTDLDDQAIKEVCALRPDLTEEAIKSFDEALADFVASPRFQVMRPLVLRRFLESDSDGYGDLDESLQSLTLGELPDLGTLELCLKPGIGARGIASLTKLLKALGSRDGGSVSGEDFMDPLYSIPVGMDSFPGELPQMPDPGEDLLPPGLHNVKHGFTQCRSEEDLPNEASQISSVEEEQLLKATFHAVKTSPDFLKFRHQRVGEYWDKENLRAPFIESMTWEQLVSLEVSILMQKRTYTQNKTFGIMQASRRLFEKYEGQSEQLSEPATVSETVERLQESKVSTVSRKRKLKVAAWKECLPDILWPYYGLSVEITGRLVDSPAPAARFLVALHENVRVETLLMGMLLPSSGEVLLRSIISSDQSCSESVEGTVVSWVSAAEKAAPALVQTFRSALAAPLVEEEALLLPFLLPDVELRYQRMMLVGLIFSLGARQVSWRNEVFDCCWTAAPRTLALVLQDIESKLPLGDEELQEQCLDLLPSITFDALKPWLMRIFQRDSNGRWRAYKQH